MENARPLQRKSYKEKVKKDNDWGKRNVDYYISISSFFSANSSSTRNIKQLYGIYNNQLPEEWFHYVKNPLNSTKADFKNFPARIRAYTIIRPNIDLLVGEFPKRPNTYHVINAGSDAYSTFQQQLKEAVNKNLYQHFINYTNQAGIETGEESEEVEPTPELVNSFIKNYKDARAVKGQKALRIIKEENSVEEIMLDLFKDWAIAGEIYSYKGVRNSDIEYERVSPLDCDYDKSPDVKYIEDGDWFTRRWFLTASDVLNRFGKLLEEDEQKRIDSGSTNGHVNSPLRTYYSKLNVEDTSRENKRDKVEVIHVTWKSQKKIGLLSYPDPVTGQLEEVEVDEDYPVDKEAGESVKWEWINEVWEGYRIDGDIYVGIQPLPIQRNVLNNFSSCKLPYNGKRFSDTHSTNISPLELGIPFQIKHIILKYRLELTIAKNKGKIALLDQNVIPRGPGWNEEKFLYYAEALGWGLINRNQQGVDKTYNQYQVLDLSLFDHIQQMIMLIDSNKREWDEVLGFNPHRKGQTQASDAVGNVKQGIFQSAIISEFIFTSFEDFVRREFKGLLDLSKFAWKDGKKKLFRNDDLREEIFNVEPGDFEESEFDIFVTNSSKESERLNALKGNATAFAQNKGKPSMIAEILGADSFAEVKSLLYKLEEDEIKLAQQMQESEYEFEERKLEIQREFEELKHSFAIDLQDRKAKAETEKMEREYDRKEGLAYIEGDVALHTSELGADSNDNGIPDINEIQKRAIEREEIYNKRTIEERKLDVKEKEINTKERTEKYKADKQLQIAKQNKNKHDKK